MRGGLTQRIAETGPQDAVSSHTTLAKEGILTLDNHFFGRVLCMQSTAYVERRMGLLPGITKEGSLADRAYSILKEAIIQNRLTPNMVLTEEQLARDLAISRTPVRQALEKLAYEKLVRFQQGRGAVVVELSEDNIRQVYEVRQLVEPATARLAARSIEPEKLEELRLILEGQKSSITARDYTSYLLGDYRFHTGIAQASRNEILHEIVVKLSVQVQRFLILSRNLPEKAGVAMEEHSLILRALEARDEDTAEEAMLEHVTKVRERLADVVTFDGQGLSVNPFSPIVSDAGPDPF